MKNAVIFIIVSLFLLSAALAAGSEGHGVMGSLSEFQADSAHVKITIDPETVQKGRVPRITATLSNQLSGSPHGLS